MLSLGSILYVGLLLVNAMAVLSEDRFLARIGWASTTVQVQANNAYGQYDQQGYGGQQDIGIKGRLVNLISAVRTLMRIPLIGINLAIILYEVLWGS